MTTFKSSTESKKLMFQFLLQEIEYHKECQYMEELVAISKEDKTLQHTLVAFMDDSEIDHFSLKFFNAN
jgi:hypothetical protein